MLDYERDQVYMDGKSVDCYSTPDDATRVLNEKPSGPRRSSYYMNVANCTPLSMCRVTHSLNIPARTTKYARCRVNGDYFNEGDTVELQPQGDGIEDVDIMSPRFLATVRSGVVFIPVSNLGKTKARVRAGKKLASVEQVEVIQTVLSAQEAHDAVNDLYGEADDEPMAQPNRDRQAEKDRKKEFDKEMFRKWLMRRAREVGRDVELIEGLELDSAQMSDEEKWCLACSRVTQDNGTGTPRPYI